MHTSGSMCGPSESILKLNVMIQACNTVSGGTDTDRSQIKKKCLVKTLRKTKSKNIRVMEKAYWTPIIGTYILHIKKYLIIMTIKQNDM